MKTLSLRTPAWPFRSHNFFGTALTLLLLLWLFLPQYLQRFNSTTGLVDPGIWQLVLLSLISFTGFTSLCWWLLKAFWAAVGLPGLCTMVLQFKQLELWQQLGFYWASFALLLLAAVGCLAAIM